MIGVHQWRLSGMMLNKETLHNANRTRPISMTETNPLSEMTLAAMPFPMIDPVIFSIGPFAIRWYALAYLAGILLGWWYLKRLTDQEGDPVGPAPLDALINASVIGIILGGRLGYVFFYNLPYYLNHPLEIFMVWHGGMSFHGGMIGMASAIFIVARRFGINPLALGDLIALAAPIGLFFGRIANFINAELYGRVTNMPWGVVFPGGGETPRHPSQLYEAGLEGLLLFLILRAAFRYGARETPGLMIGIFLSGYGLARIFIEFFREPDQQIGFLFDFLTMGQMLSLPMVIIGVMMAFFARRKSA